MSTTPNKAEAELQLPDGWSKRVDAKGRVYYANDITKTTSWSPPPNSQEVALPTGWSKRVDQKGRTYYANDITHQTSWAIPSAPAVDRTTKEEQKPTTTTNEIATTNSNNNSSNAALLQPSNNNNGRDWRKSKPVPFQLIFPLVVNSAVGASTLPKVPSRENKPQVEDSDVLNSENNSNISDSDNKENGEGVPFAFVIPITNEEQYKTPEDFKQEQLSMSSNNDNDESITVPNVPQNNSNDTTIVIGNIINQAVNEQQEAKETSRGIDLSKLLLKPSTMKMQPMSQELIDQLASSDEANTNNKKKSDVVIEDVEDEEEINKQATSTNDTSNTPTSSTETSSSSSKPPKQSSRIVALNKFMNEATRQMTADVAFVQNDPRYQRLLVKNDPKITNKEGLTQHAKNVVDPKNIPYVGLLFKGYSAFNSHANMKRMKKVEKSFLATTTDINDDVYTSIKAMNTNAKVHVAVETTSIGLDIATSLFPVTELIPGLDYYLMFMGKTAAAGASKAIREGAEVGAKIAIKKGVKAGVRTAGTQWDSKTLANWGATRAFLLYLGYPKTNSKVYAQWEASRLRLKTLYGAAPDDDLYSMEPSGDFEKELERQEKTVGCYELEISLLLLLFRAYDCWNKKYFDSMVDAKESVKHSFTNMLGIKAESLAQKKIKRHARYVFPSVLHCKQEMSWDCHRIQRLYFHQREDIVEMLVHCFWKSKRMSWLWCENESMKLRKAHHRWYFKRLVKFFLKHGQIWGIVEDPPEDTNEAEFFADYTEKKKNIIHFVRQTTQKIERKNTSLVNVVPEEKERAFLVMGSGGVKRLVAVALWEAPHMPDFVESLPKLFQMGEKTEKTVAMLKHGELLPNTEQIKEAHAEAQAARQRVLDSKAVKVPYAFLHWLAVPPSQQRKSLAKELISFLTAGEFKLPACAHVYSDENPAIFSFFESLGWESIDTCKVAEDHHQLITLSNYSLKKLKKLSSKHVPDDFSEVLDGDLTDEELGISDSDDDEFASSDEDAGIIIDDNENNTGKQEEEEQ